MTLSIVSLLKEHEPTIQESIDLTLKGRIAGGGRLQAGEIDPNLSKFIPLAGFMDDLVALQEIKEQPPTIAFIVAVDGSIPTIREQVELTQRTLGYAKLGVAQIFLEADLDLLRQAKLRLSAGNPAAYEALIKGYVKAPAEMTAMLVRLGQVLLAELIATGACTYIDPLTGNGFQISYSTIIPVGNYPVALTGADLWSAAATAKPLENLRTHYNTYYDNLFTLPPINAMSSTVMNAMLNAADTRLKIARMESGRLTVLDNPDATQVMQLPRPKIQQCEEWLSNEITVAAQTQSGGDSLTVPKFLVTDSVWYPRKTDGTIDYANKKFFLNNTGYVFLTEGIVSGAFLPTATNEFEQTIAVAMDDKYQLQPRQEYVGVDTRIMPFVRDARYLGGRRVMA
jgi:hypothetical protein